MKENKIADVINFFYELREASKGQINPYTKSLI